MNTVAAAAPTLPANERWPVIAALASHGEDAADRYLPKMVWYALGPLVASDLPRALDVLLRPELVVRQRERPDVAHAALDVRALVAGRQVVQIEDAAQVVAELDEHPFSEPGRLNRWAMVSA